jgi:ribosomal protein S18 acetylase RimI-like enzyme
LGFIFSNLTKEALPQIMALQLAYQKVYPKAVVIPGEVYLSPFLDHGKNMVCAFDDTGTMKGYTGVNIYVSENPTIPHTLWSIIKVDPSLADKKTLQDILFVKTQEKCQELLAPYHGHPARLQFQHYTGEADIMAFLKSKGCSYLESAFHMICDLVGMIKEFPTSDYLVFKCLEDEPAQKQAYLNAHNESFLNRVYTPEDFQFFLNKQVGDNGRVFLAWDKDRVVGGVTVYIDESFNKRTGFSVGQVEDVFVSESYRHHGIAAYLITLGLKYMKEIGLRFGHLEVRANNPNALRLYKKTGFVPTDETQFFYLDL